MMSQVSVELLQQRLLEQGIKVKTSWLKALIERTRSSQLETVKKEALSQWLFADLSSIGQPSLPAGLKQNKKTILDGKYTLQVNETREISQSKYGQLSQLQGKDNNSIKATAEPPEFQVHSSRMIMLSVTDGVQELFAIENQPIPTLSVNLEPGLKVLISGPIVCSLGVLLLNQNNMRLLGGNILRLKEINSQWNLLIRDLEISEEEEAPANATEERSSVNSARIKNSVNKTASDRNHRGTSESRSKESPMPSITRSVASTNQPNAYQRSKTKSSANETQSSRSSINEPKSPTQKSLPVHSVVNNGRVASMCRSHSVLQDEEEFLNSEFDDLLEEIERMETNNRRLLPSNKSLDSSDSDDFAVPIYKRSKPSKSSERILKASSNKPVNPKTSVELTNCAVPLGASLNLPTSSKTLRNLPSVASTNTPPVKQNREYSYLSSILCQEFKTKKLFTVKGFIETFLSPLAQGKDKCWQLQVLVNDGTATLEAFISGPVLSKLIGFTYEEFRRNRTREKNSAEFKTQVSAALSNCTNALINICGLIDIEIEPQKMNNCITSFKE